MPVPIKSDTQVEGFIFRRTGPQFRFLLLKRVVTRGGFWQPVTGGIHVGETTEAALRREIAEETGVTSIEKIIDLHFTFEFEADGRHLTEYVFGVEIPAEGEIRLSSEHQEYRWVGYDEAKGLMKWPTNKHGLRKLAALLGAT